MASELTLDSIDIFIRDETRTKTDIQAFIKDTILKSEIQFKRGGEAFEDGPIGVKGVRTLFTLLKVEDRLGVEEKGTELTIDTIEMKVDPTMTFKSDIEGVIRRYLQKSTFEIKRNGGYLAEDALRVKGVVVDFVVEGAVMEEELEPCQFNTDWFSKLVVDGSVNETEWEDAFYFPQPHLDESVSVSEVEIPKSVGQWSDEETDDLLRLMEEVLAQEKYTERIWSAISKQMNRDNNAVRSRWRTLVKAAEKNDFDKRAEVMRINAIYTRKKDEWEKSRKAKDKAERKEAKKARRAEWNKPD